jgi:hypothetical protein
LEPVQDRHIFRSNQELDPADDAWSTLKQAASLACQDHLLDRARADLKVALRVGLGGWPPEHMRAGIDEGQALALLPGEAVSAAAAGVT